MAIAEPGKRSCCAWMALAIACCPLRTWAMPELSCCPLRTWAMPELSCCPLRTWAMPELSCCFWMALAIAEPTESPSATPWRVCRCLLRCSGSSDFFVFIPFTRGSRCFGTFFSGRPPTILVTRHLKATVRHVCGRSCRVELEDDRRSGRTGYSGNESCCWCLVFRRCSAW